MFYEEIQRQRRTPASNQFSNRGGKKYEQKIILKKELSDTIGTQKVFVE